MRIRSGLSQALLVYGWLPPDIPGSGRRRTGGGRGWRKGGALRAELLLEYAGVDIDIQPTPKDITAGCAMSIAFPAGDLEKVRRILAEERVEFEGIYCVRDGRHARIGEKADGDGRGNEPWK